MTIRPLSGPEGMTEGVHEAASLVDPNNAAPQRGAAATVLSKAKSVQPSMLSGAWAELGAREARSLRGAA